MALVGTDHSLAQRLAMAQVTEPFEGWLMRVLTVLARGKEIEEINPIGAIVPQVASCPPILGGCEPVFESTRFGTFDTAIDRNLGDPFFP